MTVTIPRAEMADILGQLPSDDRTVLTGGPHPAGYIRDLAVGYRTAGRDEGRSDMLAVADDLDALADRYEKEAGA
ncbi:MAG: hypothetical protein ABW022_14740 [Actinoplanes sp.]